MEDRQACTGCSACAGSCPAKAIALREDERGFLYPEIDPVRCVDCGRCARVCPVNHPQFSHDTKPRFFAFAAEEALLRQSSTGGIFTLLAEEMLRRGGAVAGAAWGEDFRVSHVLVTDRNELGRLRFSKYVQSEMADIFARIQEKLAVGVPVLFTGTPCQAAGLRGFLGREYEGLITVDLLCHGVPSARMLRDHLDELCGRDTVAEVCFRKKDGWGTCLTVTRKDGTVLQREAGSDLFLRGFLNNITLRPSCNDCRFSRLPRQGDITVGDLWGAAGLNLDFAWQKGVNVVLTDTEKGRAFFQAALEYSQGNSYACRELDGSVGMNDNIFACNGRKIYRNGSFERLYPGEGFGRSVLKTMHDYDTGVVQYISPNYGSVATAVGLCAVLKEMGRKPVVLNHLRPMGEEARRVLSRAAAVSDNFLAEGDTEGANHLCDTFVVGADMSWDWGTVEHLKNAETMFLGFADPEKKRISFAPSLGYEKSSIREEYRQLLCHYLENMDFISGREEVGARMLKKFFGIEADVMPDPVLLCDPEIYRSLAGEAGLRQQGYVFAYILDPNPEKKKLLERAAKETGRKVFVALDRQFDYANNRRAMNMEGSVLESLPFEDWLSYLVHADAVVTDSFHGACLATRFHKPFLAVRNRMAHRFEMLEVLLGTDAPFAASVQEALARQTLLPTMDWAAVDASLDRHQQAARQWIRNALDGPVRPRKQDSREIADQYRRLLIKNMNETAARDAKMRYQLNEAAAINRLIDAGKTNLEALREVCHIPAPSPSAAAGLLAANGIKAYFDQVREQGCVVVLSCRDCCDSFFRQFTAQAGVPVTVFPEFRAAYLAVTDGKTMLYEKSQRGPALEYRTVLTPPRTVWGSGPALPIQVRAISMGFQWDGGAYSSILVDNIDYSCQGRGLNGVVIDNTGAVLDCWSVDTYADPSLRMNRRVKQLP